MGRIEAQGLALGVKTRARHWSAIVATASIALLPWTPPTLAQTQYAVSTTVTSSPNPSIAGQPVTISATIDAYGRAGATGSMSFSNGETSLGSAALTLAELGVAQVDSGGVHSCALANNGTVWCWGTNGSGQLGTGFLTPSLVPVQVFGITNAVSVSAGQFFSCAVLATGTVMCWGANTSGQLGNGGTSERTLPFAVSGITNATQVSAGRSHACALLSDRSLKCWGNNLSGQIGNFNSSGNSQLTPDFVSGGYSFLSVSAGSSHTCGVRTDNIAMCWGEGFYNQLGVGDTSTRYAPSFVRTDANTFLQNVLSISAGGSHTCAVVDNLGSPFEYVWCWGSNANGRLGRTVAELSTSPYALPALGPSFVPGSLGNVFVGATSVTAGLFHTCVVQANNVGRCFGYGADGRLGAGPNPIADIDFVSDQVWAQDGQVFEFASIAAGDDHNCGVRINGSLQCWGDGSSGEMGNGTTTGTNNYTVPVANLNLRTISTASTTVTSLPGGNHTLQASFAGNATLGASSASVAHTVNKINQTISFTTSAPTVRFQDPPYRPAASATSGLSVRISADPADFGRCQIDAGNVYFVGAGLCRIYADQAGNDIYNAAPRVTQSFVVGRKPQTISFLTPAPTAAKFGGSFTPFATTSEGLAAGVIYTIDSAAQGVCTINSGVVSFIGVGTCIINANHNGTGSIDVAPQVSQSFTVAKADQTVNFTTAAPTAAVFRGAAYVPGATATSGLAVALSVAPASASVCALSGGVVSFNGVGLCTLNANQAGGPNHLPATQVSQSFAVGKAAQTLTFTSLAPTAAVFGGATYTPLVTATSGLAVALTVAPASASVCALNAGVVSFTGVGTCTLNANQAGGPNHVAANQVAQSFTVGKAPQTISFTSAAPTAAVFGATYRPVVTATSNLAVALTVAPASASVCTLTAGLVSFTGIGTCTLNANQAGGTNHLAATQATQSFAVAKAPQTITFTSAAPTAAIFGGPTYTPVANSTSNLAVALTVAPASASVCTLTAGLVSFTGVGTCTLNANQAGGVNHLAATQATQSFTVAKAPQTITFTSAAPTAAIFGGPTYTPVVSSTSNLAVALTVAPASTGVCALTAGVVSFTGVGTCTLNANQAGGPNHLAATQVTQSFTVAIATQTLTFTSTAPTTAVFGGPSYTPVVTATSNLPATLTAAPASAGVCAVAAGVVTFTGAGSCVVNADQAGNSVYAAATRISQTINVAKAGMTVALTAAAATVLPGATVQLTADVNATAPSTGRPSGTVTFRRHGVVIGSPVTVDANGIARITSLALPLGSNGFTATFSGGACCNAATSANVTVIATWAVGAEARLNTTVAGNQTNATIASLATGAVAVWEQRTTTTSASIVAQRLSQQGVKLGGEIAVAATSPGAGAPQVSALDNGTFVVVWHENGPSGRDILMRRFSSAGVALGPETRANRSTTGEQAGPQVTSVAGGYIITWQTTGVDGSGAAVVFQRFTNAGAAVGTQVTVNTTTLGNQAGPAIATLSTGGFVVAWQGQVGSLFRVYARRFSATGIPAGGEIIIDASPTAVVPPIVAVTGLTGGAFAIAYDRTETASVTAPKDLYIERYAATGALTWQARANIAIAGSQLDPALASLGTDGVVVSWTTPDASGNAIDAQVFTPTGVRLQSTFRVNTAVTGNQRLSDIANTGGDGYILVWTSAGQDGTGDGVYFQRFINP
jgi:alpha-tubulin suppressor-like RCC1 family protein